MFTLIDFLSSAHDLFFYLHHSLGKFSRRQVANILLIVLFSEKQTSNFHANYLQGR